MIMKPYLLLLALANIGNAQAGGIDVCNLNPQYGYQMTPDEVRIENDDGNVLTVARSGMWLNGKSVKSFSAAEPQGGQFLAALRETIPAAIDVSRLSYERALSGLSREFYSRNRDARWVPYVRGYYRAMLDRYDAAVKTTPTVSIRPAGLSSVHHELMMVGRQGLSVQTIKSFPPVPADGITVEQERSRLDELAKHDAITRSADTMCRHVRSLGALQSKVLAGTGLSSAFEIAVAREY
jgi:hypothetical protein